MNQVKMPGDMSDRELRNTFTAILAQLNALQTMVDKQDIRIAALVENVNLLRGDDQRNNDPNGIPLPPAAAQQPDARR